MLAARRDRPGFVQLQLARLVVEHVLLLVEAVGHLDATVVVEGSDHVPLLALVVRVPRVHEVVHGAGATSAGLGRADGFTDVALA